MKPEVVGESGLVLADQIFHKFMVKFHTFRRKNHYDMQKMIKIRNHYNKTKTITKKQMKALNHYAKVYKIEINNSLQFMLEDE